MAQRAPNRLAREKSPYLLQHAHNPVDWYPWGDEAFALARAEDKPLFVSVGYSTCHWCHVMERESFEDEAIGAMLREHFVSVKVDREERPDVDRILMTAMQAMGRGGGWPLNCFLTPSGKPFFGGTYFPPHTLPGRIGMMELLPRIAAAWREERTQLEANGDRVIAMLAELSAGEAGDGATLHAFADLLAHCESALERAHDAHEGGFGDAPKFPSTVNLDLLLRRWARDPAAHPQALAMVVRQLEAMQAGGIHDHLGGGFHRYATDREWLVPHFEKMLYDQALLAVAYLEVHAATGRADFATTARAILAYVERDLASPEGAFLSAEDADSEGEEGRFYVWTPPQLEAALGPELAALFAHRYGVSAQGNFEHATSILFEAHTLAQTATAFGLTPADAQAKLDGARATLLALRATRPRPHRDDKVITAWNGLMIAAFATAARILAEPAYAATAARAAEFVWARLRGADGALLRRWREGEAAGAGQLDDHAYYAHGLLELFAATHEPRWLARAAEVTESMLARFWDERDGACFESPAGDPLVPVRMKDGFDGAEMAGNSLAAANLLRLSSLLERPDWRVKAERTLHHYAARLQSAPWAMPRMLVAMDLAIAPPRHVVIAGEPGPARDALVAAYRARWRPFDELLIVDEARRPALAALAPFAASLHPRDGHPTAHVCVDRACNLPVTEPEALAAQLDAPMSPSTME